MASAATEVALHCIICYEEFDLKDHYPVVLPCGHTYVCIVCAKRLKKCMECREPLFWNPPKPPPASQQNHHQYHRSPGHPRYHASSAHRGRIGSSRYSPSPNTNLNNTPQTPPHPSMAAKEAEEQPLPLPKNVVLMEMIEAKERQQRLLKEARRREQEERLQKDQEKRLQQLQEQLENDADEGDKPNSTTTSKIRMNNDYDDYYSSSSQEGEDEDEWLLDPALSGMAAFTGSCGTYAVREPLGLVVLPQDPNRRHQQPASPSTPAPPFTTTSSAAATVYAAFDDNDHQHRLKQEHDEKKETDPGKDDEEDRYSSFSSSKPSHRPQRSGLLTIANNNEDDDNDNMYSVIAAAAAKTSRDPFSVEVGQKLQVVGVEEGVYQLARGAGYIVANVNQLVKVGGPLETSCKLEGMLQSVTRKHDELQKQLDEINRLARGLREKIVIEQSQPEQHPVITPLENAENVDAGNHQPIATTTNEHSHLATVQDDSQPSTPTAKHKTSSDSSSPTSAGVHSTQSNDSTQVELGAPRTPGPPHSGPFLELEHGSGNSYVYDQYANSPAHSCPMPNAKNMDDQPFIDGTPTGLPRYRVNSDDDMYGLGWAGALGCGTTLFGERLLESSRQSGNDILALSFDEHSLLDNATARNRAAVLAASAYAIQGGGSQDSPLRSGGSFDGVNFRTGMSGHRGLSQPKRDRNVNHTGMLHASSASLPRRQIRMMSEHRGVAAVRGNGAPGLKRRTTPDGAMIDY